MSNVSKLQRCGHMLKFCSDPSFCALSDPLGIMDLTMLNDDANETDIVTNDGLHLLPELCVILNNFQKHIFPSFQTTALLLH